MSSRDAVAGPSSQPAGSQEPSNASGKVKQTRRRQRLSCVECTKRRQKCDRQIPCGLCTSRGIPHLCRWEPIVVRPTPQRPPLQAQHASQQQPGTVEALLARVSALEEALRRKNAGLHSSALASSASSPGDSSSSSETNRNCYGVPTSGELKLMEKRDGPVALIDFDVQQAAVALAQLSLAPRTEYIGAGSVLCAIHRLGDPDLCRLPYPHSTMMRARKRDSDDPALASPIRSILTQLPPRAEVENLINIYFMTRNVEFGIPEAWFRAAMQTMWFHMERECDPGCPSNGGCISCSEEVNPHWLALFFSILAVTPYENGSRQRTTFFNNAIVARRLTEDIFLTSPGPVPDSAVAGSVLSCLGAAILSAYLADHGRVSEAWKLVGSGLRCGQAIGLHRDCQWNKWEKMGSMETELRTLTWWLLVCADRQYSFLLGRPVMAQKDSFEIATLPAAQHGDGSQNPHVLYREQMCKLSELVCKSGMKCLQWSMPTYQIISELDKEYAQWEKSLPARLRWRPTDAPAVPEDNMEATPHRMLQYQKVLLQAWSLDTIMGIHRLFLMERPPSLGPEVDPGRNPARERCIEAAIELTSVLVDFYNETSTWPAHLRTMPTGFQYFLFDGAVALVGALSQVPPHPQFATCLSLMGHAMGVLEELATSSGGSDDRDGEVAKRGNAILKALMRAGGWDTTIHEKGTLVSFSDLEKAQPSGSHIHTSVPSFPSHIAPPPDFFPPPTSGTHYYQHNAAFSQSRERISHNTSPHSLSPSPPRSSNSPQGSLNISGPASSYVAPTISPSLSGSSTFGGMFSGGAQSSSGSATATNISAATPASMFPGIGGGGPQGSGVGSMVMPNPRVATAQQSMLPYDVLQGAQQQPMGFDLDWVRLAGMEQWYSGGFESNSASGPPS